MYKEIFKAIAERQLLGVMFHSEMIDYYNFLNLELFKNLHECRYYEESKTLREIKDFFINTNHEVLILDHLTSFPSVIPESWEGKHTSDVDKDSLSMLLKSSFQKYYDWENETCLLYKKMAQDLFDQHFYNDYCFLNKIIDKVEIEKSHLISIINDLALVDYDFTKIQGFQYKIK